VSEVALEINGVEHKGWLALEVTKSLETLCGSFQMVLTDRWNATPSPMNLIPGSKCKVTIDGEQVIDGYIDVVEIQVAADRHEIRVSGRDKTGDLVDCAVTTGTGEWRNLKLEDLVEKLVEPFGIEVKTEVETGELIPKFNVEQGMTVFEAVQKLCALRGCLAVSDSEGNLVITRAASERAASKIEQGKNLLEGTATYDFTERFSEYIVKGQRRTDDNVDARTAATAKGKVTDENVERFRPMLIVAEGQADKAKTEARARWEAAVRRGRSRAYEVMVNGWKDERGGLWKINTVTTLKAAMLGVNADLLIASASFVLDDRGEITRLRVVPPETYTPEPGEKVPVTDTWQDDLENLGSLGDA
jgi:prophage tail gpP-like protein